MALQDCSPIYTYRPVFVASATPCAAGVYTEHRSRLFAGGTYFRSQYLIGSPGVEVQGTINNDISLEIQKATGSPVLPTGTFEYTLIVRFQTSIVETYTVTQIEDSEPPCSDDAIGTLRTDVNANSDYISMPGRGSDTEFDDTGTDSDCLSEFTESSMTGGSGGPSDDSALSGLRTGPDRSIIIIATTEDTDGEPIAPSAAKKVQQWDGSAWITYTPNADCRPF